jgi:hypothetical protein
MKRYLKQKPKYSTKCTDIVRESELYTRAAFTISGKNKAGKQLVKFMQTFPQINKEQEQERSDATDV